MLVVLRSRPGLEIRRAYSQTAHRQRRLPAWAKHLAQRPALQPIPSSQQSSFPMTVQNVVERLSTRLQDRKQSRLSPHVASELDKAVGELMFSVCIYSLRARRPVREHSELQREVRLLSPVLDLRTLDQPQLTVLSRKVTHMSRLITQFDPNINAKEFHHWFTAVTSSDAGGCFCALKKCQSKIPAFVVYDSLLREPTKQDFPRWLAYFRRYRADLVALDQDRKLLKTLVRQSMEHDKNQLKQLLREYLSLLKGGPRVNHELNELVWYVASLDERGNIVQQAQTLIANHLLKLSPGVSAKQVLDVNGLLGFAYTLAIQRKEEARTVVSLAKDSFDLWKLESFNLPEFEHITKPTRGLDWATRMLIDARFVVVELMIAASGEDLQRVLQRAVPLRKHILESFPDFYGRVVTKMNDLAILTEQRALLAWESYLQQAPAKLDQKLLTHAIYVIDNIPRLVYLIERTVGLGYELNTDIALAFIRKLYSHSLLRARQPEQPVLGIFTRLESLKDAARTHYEPAGFGSTADLARYLYFHIEEKDKRFVSMHLYYESLLDPQNALDRYMDLSQPEKYVWSLLLAVLRADELPQYRDEELKWRGKYAIDCAIGEFHNVTNFLRSPSNPAQDAQTHRNWMLYIRMLGKYQATDYLNEILQWWVELRYVPSRTLLAFLLAHIEEFAQLNEYYLAYRHREERYLDGTLRSEKELNALKKRDIPLQIPLFNNNLDEFVKRMQENYSVVRSWDWPGAGEVETARRL